MAQGALYGLILAFVCILLEYAKEALFGIGANGFQLSGTEKIISNPLLYLLPICLLSPIFEELVFRHLVFGQLKRWNRAIAYTITALLFALLHIDFFSPLHPELTALPLYILSAVVLSYSYEKNGLWGSIATHSANNLIAFVLVFLH